MCKGKSPIRIEAQEILQRGPFYYLVSIIISMGGEIEEDVKHRIRAGLLKWRLASRVLCDRRIPIRLKRKFYK